MNGKVTVGAAEKSESVAMMAAEPSVYASEYSLYLPNKELLQQKVSQWTKELDNIGIQ